MKIYNYFLLLLGIMSVNSQNWFERRFVPSTPKPSLSFARWSGEKCDLNTNVLYSNPSQTCFQYCTTASSQYNFGKCYLRNGFGECECVYFENTD